MVKTFRLIFFFLICVSLLLVSFDLDKSTDLYYYINEPIDDWLIRKTGSVNYSQNNFYGIEKRWFMWPVSNQGIALKITYLSTILSLSHLFLVYNLKNYYGLKTFSLVFFTLLFNYYFYANGLHLVRQMLAINIGISALFIASRKWKYFLLLLATVFHEIILLIIPIILLFPNRNPMNILLGLIILLMIFFTGVTRFRLYIIFMYIIYIRLALQMRKIKLT